jgi:hypothetical protein
VLAWSTWSRCHLWVLLSRLTIEKSKSLCRGPVGDDNDDVCYDKWGIPLCIFNYLCGLVHGPSVLDIVLGGSLFSQIN